MPYHKFFKTNMSSIEVFDYDKRDWVPYTPGVTNVTNTNTRMAQQLKDTQIKLAEAEQTIQQLSQQIPIVVKQVTPVAEAMERAKSQIKRQKRRGSPYQQRPPGRIL